MISYLPPLILLNLALILLIIYKTLSLVKLDKIKKINTYTEAKTIFGTFKHYIHFIFSTSNEEDGDDGKNDSG
ncbi:hypothetical protein [Vallitalea sp.]|jgi:hypothetical protein|uniref:hypothetical protein n=1 Tax=Vallitalea sp. TaxID=1882829 RepID=UPI0025F28AC2|nr:hypothetical protein [Vallitalea sp.]MCT4688817.1 hypothetical protein [Vallitalea sp.]